MSHAILSNSAADEATPRFSSFKRASPQIEAILRQKFALLRQPLNDDAIELVDGSTIIERHHLRNSSFILNVSASQAAITVRDDRVFVQDLSKNGTFIKKTHDGEFRRMKKEPPIVEIKDGDLIAFGGPEFIINKSTLVHGKNPYIYKLVSPTNTYVRK